MNNRAFALLLTGVFLLTGCAQIDGSNPQTKESVKENVSIDDKFDTDIDTLTYKLPNYTKLCTPESRYDCSANECIKGKPNIFVLYDENRDKVYRCDTEPCDEYDVKKEESGLYTNLTPITPNGSFIKLSNKDEYTEVVSLGLNVLIYKGKCTDKKIRNN